MYHCISPPVTLETLGVHVRMDAIYILQDGVFASYLSVVHLCLGDPLVKVLFALLTLFTLC